VTLVGCGPKEIASDDQPDQTAETNVTYSAKKGLLLSPETSRFIGLETVEVSERPIQATNEISARVFRAATTNDPRALASAVVSAADAAMLRPGLTSIQTPSSPAAEVLRLDRSEEPRTGMVEAILQVGDPSLALNEGGFVSVRFAIGSTNAVTVVPNAALFHTTAGDFVYLENGAHFARAAVTAGRTDGEFTEITDGLLAGDMVVVKSVMTLWMTELHNVNGGDACCIKRETKR
ncbi:MAG TPA: hypothetical protein VNT99_12585, partial [Methylomirabilota bacterium]|nr:hypothetical protein [Methylomirabilota bacterium]